MRQLGVLLAAVFFVQTASDRTTPVTDVRVDDPFWRTRLEGKPSVSVPHSVNAAYLDLLEFLLSNGTLPEATLKEGRLVYPNPLSSGAAVTESFDLSCCGADSQALVPISQMIYGQSNATLHVNLFVTSEARTQVATSKVRVAQRTRYPWDGNVELRIDPDRPATFTVAMRVPGWARGVAGARDSYKFHYGDTPAPTLIVNGQATRPRLERSFASITREWRHGDVVHLYFPMPVQRVLVRQPTPEMRGRAAIQQGPVIYVVDESARSDDVLYTLPLDAELSHEYRQDQFGGGVVITGPAIRAVPFYATTDRDRQQRVWLRY